MSEEEKPKKDPDENKLILKLGEDDSALVVRTNGEIELISRDLQGKEDNYLGDLEDLNKTFTLVLAFAAALENEQLYNHLFQNLNHILHRQWNKLPPDEKARIKEIRMHHLLHPDENDKKNKKGEDKLAFVKFNMMIGFHNLFLQMMYNKMTNRLLHADMMEVYKEAFAPKVYKNLGILETVFLNPRKGDNYQLLQQVFNERKQETQAPSVFDL